MNIIKKRREELSMTQVELAKRLNIRKSCICNYEKGRRMPRIDLAKRIGEELAFPWHQIFEEERE